MQAVGQCVQLRVETRLGPALAARLVLEVEPLELGLVEDALQLGDVALGQARGRQAALVEPRVAGRGVGGV